jgi:hypothetical protein
MLTRRRGDTIAGRRRTLGKRLVRIVNHCLPLGGAWTGLPASRQGLDPAPRKGGRRAWPHRRGRHLRVDAQRRPAASRRVRDAQCHAVARRRTSVGVREGLIRCRDLAHVRRKRPLIARRYKYPPVIKKAIERLSLRAGLRLRPEPPWVNPPLNPLPPDSAGTPPRCRARSPCCAPIGWSGRRRGHIAILSAKGRVIVTALMALRNVGVEALTKLAA